MKFNLRRPLSAFSILFVLLLVLAAASCSRIKPSKTINESSRREIASSIKIAVRDAGGSNVWIKHSGHSRRGPRLQSNLEILSTPASFRAVLSAVRQEAGKFHLAITAEASTTPEKLTVVTINVAQRTGARVLQIQLHEVPRLLRAAIVIDDIGNDIEPARKLAALNYPITFSVLPHLSYTKASAEEAHQYGHEVMLHLPMEPEAGSRLSPGKGAVLVGMNASEVEKTIADDLDSVPYVRGVNNHMGSRATQDSALMTDVMKTLSGHCLYFIDSRTTPSSVALKAARQEHVPAFYRSVFLDDTKSVDYTLGQLREFRRIVQQEGVAIAIGHPHATTITALEEFLPEFERADIELVTPSQIVRLPEIPALHPHSHAEAIVLTPGED